MHRELTGDQPTPEGVPPAAAGSVTEAPTMPARRVIAIALGALVIGALLNAQSLLETAERQPFGTTRTVAMAFAEPLARISSTLRLDHPRSAIDGVLHPQPELVVAEPEPEATSEAPAAVSSPTPAPTTQPSPSPSPTPTERVVTAEEPLRVYVAGDSMVGQFGPAMVDLLDDTGVVTAESRAEFASGLTRPDFIDWPSEISKLAVTSDPEVLVFIIGGNDPQPMKLDGVVYEPGDDAWVEEYTSRVASFMAQLDDQGLDVYWVGMPIARDADYSAKMELLNGIYATESERYESITFVRSWDLFAGPDGRFSEYLPNRNGDVVDMRLNDGIHLTTAGAYRLARLVVAEIASAWDLPIE